MTNNEVVPTWVGRKWDDDASSDYFIRLNEIIKSVKSDWVRWKKSERVNKNLDFTQMSDELKSMKSRNVRMHP